MDGVEQSRRSADAARRARYLDEKPDFDVHEVTPRDGNFAVQFRLKQGPAPLAVTARIDGLAYTADPGTAYALQPMPVSSEHIVVGTELTALAKCHATPSVFKAG